MAALSVSSRRLPGMTQRNVLPIASIPLRIQPAHRTATPRDIPGAACCRAFRSGRSPSAKFVAFETVRAKAAPLQAFGPLDTQRVCNPPVFLPHPSKRPLEIAPRCGVGGALREALNSSAAQAKRVRPRKAVARSIGESRWSIASTSCGSRTDCCCLILTPERVSRIWTRRASSGSGSRRT
jgi:hypothetical protein